MTSRRRWLLAAAGHLVLPFDAAAALPAAQASRDAAASSHFPMGPVVPARALERWPVVTHAGAATDLPTLLRGKVTALQLMFTGCGATCPIQGALFAQAQALVAKQLPAAQFVSLSVDPLGDSPVALGAWLKRLSAAPGWLAAAPRVADVDAIVERIGRGGEKRPPGPDPHLLQVFVFDTRAELVWRTASLPTAGQIAEALHHFAQPPSRARTTRVSK